MLKIACANEQVFREVQKARNDYSYAKIRIPLFDTGMKHTHINTDRYQSPFYKKRDCEMCS